MRLYRDRPDILVPGRWYWCPEGAVDIPYAHRFLSYRLDDFTNEGESPDIGEISHWDGQQTHQGNPRYTGQHWCGSEDFWVNGVPYALRGTQQLDWEGVPLCCITSPLRPGGGLAQGKGSVFSQLQALWWLRPEELAELSDGDPVEGWPSASYPPNPALGGGGIASPRKNGMAVSMFQSPPHAARSFFAATHGFSLTQGSWYLVGCGTLLTAQNGIGVLGNGPFNPYSWKAEFKRVVAGVVPSGGVIYQRTGRPPYAIYQMKKSDRISVWRNGVKLAENGIPANSHFTVAGFDKLQEVASVFLGAISFLSEFLLFDRILKPSEDAFILNYLSEKYDIPLAFGGYFGQDYWTPNYFPQGYY